MSEKCSVCGKGGKLQTIEARVERVGSPLLKIKLCEEHGVQFETKAISIAKVEEVDE